MSQTRFTRRGRFLVRFLVIVSIVAVSVAIFAAPVTATAPVKYSFTFSFSIDLYDICSFPITLDSTITATEIDYFDQSGNMTHQFGSGLFEKVPLPDGSLFIGAGRADFVARGALIILSPDKGNPGNVAGFCAALAP